MMDLSKVVRLRRRTAMLDLDSPRWSQLQHAYGPASDIPDLLRQLETLPAAEDESTPWSSLWSSLAHQGDVYPASFAAVPHVVRALAADPGRADCAFFQFPAWVEICRQKKAVPVPPDLTPAYLEALAQLPALVATAASREWEPGFLCCALSAVAAAKGQGAIAEAVLELTPDVAEKFIRWFFSEA
jgi:hypothetical protein